MVASLSGHLVGGVSRKKATMENEESKNLTNLGILKLDSFEEGIVEYNES